MSWARSRVHSPPIGTYVSRRDCLTRRWHRGLWKTELQAFANRTGLNIGVSHFPPGTSKWNKIEHRLFCHITENWRGRPLIDHETVVQLIGSVRTKAGLLVKAKLDTRAYPIGIKVGDDEMEGLNIVRDEFHGEWNYAFTPAIRRAAGSSNFRTGP